MCVNRGNNLGSTIERTAQLTARLMRQYDIPLNHVVPHMYWRRVRYSDRRDLGFKRCPRILLDRGRLGPKWSARKREIQIKKWSRAKKEALIAGDFVKLKNLSHSTRS
jgi:hypothetical protein